MDGLKLAQLLGQPVTFTRRCESYQHRIAVVVSGGLEMVVDAAVCRADMLTLLKGPLPRSVESPSVEGTKKWSPPVYALNVPGYMRLSRPIVTRAPLPHDRSRRSTPGSTSRARRRRRVLSRDDCAPQFNIVVRLFGLACCGCSACVCNAIRPSAISPPAAA